MTRNIFDLVKSGLKISSAPDIYIKLTKLIDNPRGSYSDMAGIIARDTALSARLLKIANSSFYNFPSKIDTISQAITIIGTQQLSDLVLATSVLKTFRKIPKDLVSMESFWRHSIACGLAARTIAVYRREPNVERFYIAGLLHEIGRLVIFENLPDLARETIKIHESEHKFLHHAEQEVLGFDHAAVGGAVLREWRLPDNLVEPVAFHHQPLEARNCPIEAAIVHFSDILACAMQLGTSRECYVPPVEPKVWDKIHLPVGQLEAVWNQVDKTFNETIEFFL